MSRSTQASAGSGLVNHKIRPGAGVTAKKNHLEVDRFGTYLNLIHESAMFLPVVLFMV